MPTLNDLQTLSDTPEEDRQLAISSRQEQVGLKLLRQQSCLLTEGSRHRLASESTSVCSSSGEESSSPSNLGLASKQGSFEFASISDDSNSQRTSKHLRVRLNVMASLRSQKALQDYQEMF